ncbi:MAG: hypothetical protein HFJ89_02225 [Oscillospiraceae bacterium]|jgi:hypothetical protein|nr:hypothetical protein [Oscillospiraceae bacterium]
MKKNLEEIREELETEIDTARALFEIMTLIHTGSYCFEKNEITFESVKNAFFLFSQISLEHVHSLDTIANELIDFHNDLKNK